MDVPINRPQLLLLAICDQAITDQASGKVSLIGLFEQLNAVQFPTTFSFAVAFRILGLPAGTTVSLSLAGDAGKEMQIVEKRFDTPHPIEQIVLNIGGANFDQPGGYSFIVRADAAELGRLPFQLVKADAPGSKVGQA
jgi:hypothetical protein